MGLKKDEVKENLGRVVVYGRPIIEKDYDENFIKSAAYESAAICEVLTVREIFKDRIVTDKYVLPLADAFIHTSTEGTIYSYNCTLPYLKETAHLAEVEQNIIISQAFAYQGRMQKPPQTSMTTYIFIGVLALLAIIGMFK